jgi:hypothetical protein
MDTRNFSTALHYIHQIRCAKIWPNHAELFRSRRASVLSALDRLGMFLLIRGDAHLFICDAGGPDFRLQSVEALLKAANALRLLEHSPPASGKICSPIVSAIGWWRAIAQLSIVAKR